MNDNSKFNRLMMGIMLPKITLKNHNKNNNHEKIKRQRYFKYLFNKK